MFRVSHKTKIAIGRCHKLIVESTGINDKEATKLMADILRILDNDWVLEARKETADTVISVVNEHLKDEKLDAKFKLNKITNKTVEISSRIGDTTLSEGGPINGRAAEEGTQGND